MAADNPVKKITAGRVNDVLNGHIQKHADPTNDRVLLLWYSTATTSNQPFVYQFMYKIK